MKKALLTIAFLTPSAALPMQIDQVCRAYCSTLAVQGGAVRLIEQGPHAPRNVILGRYVFTAQSFVPKAEAPIRDFRSPSGWRIVASAFLHHDPKNEGIVGLRLRFLDPAGVERLSEDVLMSLERAEIGKLFGGPDDIFAISSNEEHAYNTQTKIWFLPESGKPKLLLTFAGVFEAFSNGSTANPRGVRIARQTYDGVHAEAKGTVQEFYAWDGDTKSLKLRK